MRILPVEGQRALGEVGSLGPVKFQCFHGVQVHCCDIFPILLSTASDLALTSTDMGAGTVLRLREGPQTRDAPQTPMAHRPVTCVRTLKKSPFAPCESIRVGNASSRQWLHLVFVPPARQCHMTSFPSRGESSQQVTLGHMRDETKTLKWAGPSLSPLLRSIPGLQLSPAQDEKVGKLLVFYLEWFYSRNLSHTIYPLSCVDPNSYVDVLTPTTVTLTVTLLGNRIFADATS